MESDIIDRSSFPTFTQGRFEPCDAPEREPDFRSARSAYWYTDEGVTRLSDHWGTHINSCSWQLGDEALEPCWKGKKKGQRAGRAAWKDLSTPNVTIRVTHRFGELDYSKLGAEPLSTGHDPEYGDYDVFAIRREWFIDHSRFTVAGRTLSYQGGRGGGSTSALGEGYADPAARAMSLDWEDHRLEAKERGEKADFGEWAASKVSDPVYGGIARRLSGASAAEPQAAEPADEAPQEKQAFAVYCDADRSLRFYSREVAPQEGEVFEGRTSDAVYAAEAFDEYRWCALADEVETVSVVDEGVAPESTREWFRSFDHMTSCDLAKLDTSNVTSMRRMLDGCSSLGSLDLSGFDTARVEDMTGMFRGCSSLKTLDLSGFETGNVENMAGMFHGCWSLESLDLSSFDTSGVRDLYAMFACCDSLTSLDLSGFDTGNAEDMAEMFHGCSSLESLDLSSFDTSGVRDLYAMFAGCDSLKELDVSSFDTSSVMDEARYLGPASYANAMFDGCDALPPETVRAFEAKLAGEAPQEEASRLPLYRAADDKRILDQSIAALEDRAQGFPAEARGWAMLDEDGGTVRSMSLGALLDGAEVVSLDENEGRLIAALRQDPSRVIAYEIRLSPSPDAGWDDCEPPHVGLWAAECLWGAGAGEPMQWVIGAYPSEAELVSAEPGGSIRAIAAAEEGGTWSATVTDAGREVERVCGLASAEEARRACEMGAFRRGCAVCADSAAQFAEVAKGVEAAKSGTLSAFASAPGIDGEALLADWARESHGADPEKTPALDAAEALGPLSAYARGNARPAVQESGRTVEAVREGAASAGICRTEEMGVARAASVDAAVSMMSKGAVGAAIAYRDLAFAPAADGTWIVMKQSAEGAFSPFEAGWRPGILSFDEKAASAEIAKMEAATLAECSAGTWAEAGARTAEAREKTASAKHMPAPPAAGPAMLVAADAPGSSSRGAR